MTLISLCSYSQRDTNTVPFYFFVKDLKQDYNAVKYYIAEVLFTNDLGNGRTVETLDYIKEYEINLGDIRVIDLLPFKKYINEVYHSKFIISDSGTAQEEPSILGTPVIVPRDFTERPESVENNCSFMINVNDDNKLTRTHSESWLLLN